MKMKETYKTIKNMTPRSKLERFAINTLLNMFPEEPCDACDEIEQRDYNRAYNLMVPEQDFTDHRDYAKWLEAKNINRVDLLVFTKRFQNIQLTVESAGII